MPAPTKEQRLAAREHPGSAAVMKQDWTHLPYQHARMRSTIEGGTLSYYSTRKGDAQTQTFRYPAKLSHPQTAEPESIEFFLLERYRLFSSDRSGALYSGLVHHQPYRFEKAEIADYSNRLLSLCGFEEPNTPPVSALIAELVSVTIHPLKKN